MLVIYELAYIVLCTYLDKAKGLALASPLCGEWDLNPHDLKRSQDP